MDNQPPANKKPPANALVEAGSPQPETELSDATPPAPEAPKKPPTPLSRLVSFSNKYLFIFILLVLTVAAISYIALSASKKSNNQNSITQSLTSAQLASLKGNTTIVGTSQETLDIQSNAVFEGTILARNDLDVAGSLKIGGALTLPSITVGGSSSFGNAQVNGNLSVAGTTILQSQVNISKNLAVAGSGSFGSLSTGQLNISSLNLTGDLTVSRHIAPAGGLPGKTDGSALGSGGTASVSGTDTAGTVTISTGNSPPAGCFVTINFTAKFNSTPHVVISPSNSSSGGLAYYTNRSATSFSICDANAPTAGTNYIFDYIVFD